MKVSIIPFILKKLKQGLGIVQDTDTATQAIAKDKYVFWKGSVKKASSAISQNDTLSASNLSDVTDGALNAISEQVGNIGYIKNGTDSGSVAVPSEKGTKIASITLTKGTWIVVACCDWGYGANGYRQLAFSSSTINPARQNTALVNTAGASKETYHQIIKFIETNGETLDVYGYHNNGSTVNAYPYIYAIRIK